MEHAIAFGRGSRVGRAPALWVSLSIVVLALGCGGGESSPAGAPGGGTGAEDGLSLPAGYKTVDRPLEERKQIYEEASLHRIKALAEANAALPMDEVHLPKLDKPAFDKRMAEHKAILDPILDKGFAAIAEKHGITVEDVGRIEDEANRLRWTPPEVEPAKTKPADAKE